MTTSTCAWKEETKKERSRNGLLIVEHTYCCGPTDAKTLPKALINQIVHISDREHEYLEMPYSGTNMYPDFKEKDKLIQRWELIAAALQIPAKQNNKFDAKIFQAKMQHFNHTHRFDYSFISTFLEMHKSRPPNQMQDKMIDNFFEVILSDMMRTAFDMYEIISTPIKLLFNGRNKYGSMAKIDVEIVTLSELQGNGLLIAAFFSMFQRRTSATLHVGLEYGDFPDINFGWFLTTNQSTDRSQLAMKYEKLLFFIHCFTKSLQNLLQYTGRISFIRQKIECFPKWHNSTKMICNVIFTDEKIEDVQGNLLRVDFANRTIGGGVFGQGALQEEILFLSYPQMFLARLLCESMCYNEAIIMRGLRRFSSYKGYARTFAFNGDYNDTTAYDSEGFLESRYVAIDAFQYRDKNMQYLKPYIERDLRKAYTGFRPFDEFQGAVCTGMWGCGAFGGDPELKFLIQLLACSQSDRDMIFSTNGYKKTPEMKRFHLYLKANNKTVGDLYQQMMSLGNKLNGKVFKVLRKYI